MAFCTKCGTQIDNTTKFCPNCGEPVSGQQYEQPYRQGPVMDGGDTQYDFGSYSDGYGGGAQYHPADVENNKLMAVLAYIGILVLIPIFAAKDSPYARFHANQGLVLFIAEIIWGVVRTALSTLILSISWNLSWLTSLLGLVNLAFFVFSVMGIVYALQGKAKELPLVGRFRLLR